DGKAFTHVSTRLPGLPVPQWLRVVRHGDQWDFGWSIDGLAFTYEPTCFIPLRVRRVGPYVGHAAGFSHTGRIESFVNVATPPPDLRPPSIDQVGVASNDVGALVRWVTDEPSSSAVDFGTGPAYGSTI